MNEVAMKLYFFFSENLSCIFFRGKDELFKMCLQVYIPFFKIHRINYFLMGFFKGFLSFSDEVF